MYKDLHVSFVPLPVVHQTPGEVSLHVAAVLVYGVQKGVQVMTVIRHSGGILDAAEVGVTVLRYNYRNILIGPANPSEETT